MNNKIKKDPSKVTVLEPSANTTVFHAIDQGAGSEQNVSPLASIDTSNQVLDTREVKQPAIVRLSNKAQSTLEDIFSGKCDLKDKDVMNLIHILGGRVSLQSPYTGTIFWGDSQKKAGIYERRVEAGCGLTVRSCFRVKNAIEVGVRSGYIPEELISQFKGDGG